MHLISLPLEESLRMRVAFSNEAFVKVVQADV